MSEQSVIVWDLETIPDLPAAARMLDLPNGTDAEVPGKHSGPGSRNTRFIKSHVSARWSRAVARKAGAWTPSARRTSATGPRPN
jgi:hypothetical protein